MTDELGRAELQLGADLIPFDADLKDAEARAALSVAKIQAMFDSLHLDAEVKGAVEALAARATQAGVPGPASSSTVVGGRNEIWGVRGPDHPGSLQNPITTVVAAGKYFPMGSYAAAVGDDNAQDQTGARNSQSGIVTAADLAALTDAIHQFSQNSSPGAQLAAAGAGGLGGSGSNPQQVPVVLDDGSNQALRDIAATLSRLEQRENQAGGGHTILVDHAAGTSGGGSRTFITGPGGGGTTVVGSRGEQTVRIDDAQYAGLLSAMLSRGGGGGGGIGTTLINPEHRSVDVFYHRDPATGAAQDTTSLLGALGFSHTGLMTPFAKFGSAGSFAGFGFEHFLTTLLGVAGSASGALGGAGILGLGALGAGGVGFGSDLGVSVSAASDTKLLYTDYTALANAVDQYGKKSQQAAAAQSQLNFDIKDTLQGTPGVYAELALAKQLDDLNTLWDKSTSQARVLFAEIADQAVKLANVYMPLVIQAADQNLSIINKDIRPLFTWLEGPEGIQIWRDLENVFATDLPSGIGAFTQAVELITRVMDLASQDVGGFTNGLDRLFTRLNSESNASLDQEVQKLVGDFKLWEHFVVLLTEDIYGLFHQDVGTGNSIIATLNGALEKLREYEQSAKGQGELTNIFMVHKTEILELIDVFGKLSNVFGHIYLSVAPALVTVMNDAVLPALKAVADVVAFLAGKSQVLATLMGIALITAKFGGVGAVGDVIGGASGFITGKVAASAAGATAAGTVAEGAEGAAAVGGLPALLGLLPGLSAEGVAATLGAVLPVALPIVAAAAGTYILGHDVLGIGKTTPIVYGPNGPVVPRQQSEQQSVATEGAGAFGGNASLTPIAQRTTGVTPNFAGATLNIQEVGKFAHYSAGELEALIKAMKEAGSLQLNGTSVPKQQLISLAEAALKLKDEWNTAFNEAWDAANNFFKNSSHSLPALYDDYNTAMRRIADTVGLTSKEGQKDMATAIGNMVEGIQTGLANGTIKAQSGITAIWQVLGNGMKSGAITWQTEWTDMFNTVAGLYLTSKISAQQYALDINGILQKGQSTIASTVHSSWQGIFNDLKQQFNHGVITQGQYNQQVHEQTVQMNATAASDFAIFTGNVAAQMIQAGTATKTGMAIIGSEMNAALKALGEPPISFATVASSPGAGGASLSTLQGLAQAVPAGATGLKVNAPMYLAGEEAPGHPEYVLATNPAYRERNLGLWAAAGHDLGIPGFAAGGVTDPTVHGGGPAYNELVTGALAKITKDAQAFLGKTSGGTGGGKGGGGGFAVNVPGGVVGWLTAAMAAAGVAGPAWLSMLERQVMRESSGNPNAINLTDINAREGNPSIGLLQTTGSTFNEYELPGHGNIRNPVDNAIAAIRYIISRYGHGSAAAGLQFMIANGGNAYAQGGIPGFAAGGALLGGIPSTPAQLNNLFGGAGSAGSALLAGIGQGDLTSPFASGMGQISSLIGPNGDVNRLGDLLSYWQGMWGLNQTLSGIMSGGPSAAILTDANGNPYIDQTDFNSAVADLTQEVGWEGQIVKDLQTALALSQMLPPQINAQIKAFKAKIAAIKKKIQENLKRINQLQAMINTEQGKKKPNYKSISAWKNQILGLETENAQLGGDKTAVGSGGQIGALTSQVTTLQNDLQTLSGYPNQIGGAGGSGLGGQLGPAKVSLAQFSQELAALSPTALTAALTAAQTQSGSSSSSQLDSLVEQQNATLAGMYDVSQAQYSLFQQPMYGLPAFGGSFANGGIVPGFPGEPRMILAHGGETVTPAGGGTHVNVNVSDGMGWLKNLINVEISKSGRANARTAHRKLPGLGGGYLLPS